MTGTGQPKTAFVFAGGGSFGAIQVGMLHALTAHGIVADMACGSSVGAVNAAYYAGNPTIEGIRELEAIWRALRRQDVFPMTMANVARVPAVAGFSGDLGGLAKSHRNTSSL